MKSECQKCGNEQELEGICRKCSDSIREKVSKSLSEYRLDDDQRTAMVDLVADMLHYADMMKIDFDGVLESARRHHFEEK